MKFKFLYASKPHPLPPLSLCWLILSERNKENHGNEFSHMHNIYASSKIYAVLHKFVV